MDNPYIGMAEGLASAAMGAQARNQSAQYSQAAAQQKAQQAMLKDQFDQELKLRDKGYTPYMETTGQKSSGLKTRDAQQVDPNRVITDPYGRQWVTPAGKPDSTPQQGYTDLQSALSKGGEPLNDQGNVWEQTTTPRLRMDESGNTSDTGQFGVHVAPPDASRVVTLPGSGRQVYMPTEAQSLSQKLQTEAANKAPARRYDSSSFSAPVIVNEENGQAMPVQLPPGVTAAAPPQGKYNYNHFTDDSGRVNVTRIGETGTPERWNGKAWETLPAGAAMGPKRRDPDKIGERALTPGQEDVQKRFTSRELRSANTIKTTRLAKAESDFAKELRDAGTDAGKLQSAKDRLWNAKQVAQDEYEQAVADLGLNVQHVDYGQQRNSQQQGTNGQQQAPNTQQKGRGKLTDTTIASTYMQKAGGNKEVARKLAKADGWEF